MLWFQLPKIKRKKRYKRIKNIILFKNPQRKAICIRLTTLSPKKPNSANRRVAKVNLNTCGKLSNITVKIPGEGHNLQQHSTILLKGSRIRDLIGVNNSAIRGKFDLAGVVNRKTSKSLYGVKTTVLIQRKT